MEDLETLSKLPTWVNISLGFLAALGGFEFIKWLVSLIVNWHGNKRKNSAEAKESEAIAHQQAATAGQQDADWREKELQLMTSFVNTAKEQYEDLTRRYDELKAERSQCHKDRTEMMMEMRKFETLAKDNARKIEGLQKAFNEEVAKRRAAERLYCSIETCKKRQPPLGTFSSDNDRKNSAPNKSTSKRIQKLVTIESAV